MREDYGQDRFFVKEAEYRQRMEDEVVPFLQEHVQEMTIRSADETQIRCYYLVNPDERAAVAVSHGFCEFYGKYQELLWYLYKAGYSVFFLEYRGHGHSQHLTDDLSKVHIHKDFTEYVADLKAMVDQVLIPNSKTGRYFLYCHSMGGAVGAMFLETYPKIFERAVLSSPMLEANYAGLPLWVVRCLMGVAVVLRWTEKWAPGQGPFDPTYPFESGCSQSRARYDRVMELRKADSQCQTNGGTYSWGAGAVKSSSFIRRNAGKVRIPVLLVQAGKDTLVKAEAQQYFADHSANTRLICFEESKHEIFNGPDAVVPVYFRRVFDFLLQGVPEQER